MNLLKIFIFLSLEIIILSQFQFYRHIFQNDKIHSEKIGNHLLVLPLSNLKSEEKIYFYLKLKNNEYNLHHYQYYFTKEIINSDNIDDYEVPEDRTTKSISIKRENENEEYKIVYFEITFIENEKSIVFLFENLSFIYFVNTKYDESEFEEINYGEEKKIQFNGKPIFLKVKIKESIYSSYNIKFESNNTFLENSIIKYSTTENFNTFHEENMLNFIYSKINLDGKFYYYNITIEKGIYSLFIFNTSNTGEINFIQSDSEEYISYEFLIDERKLILENPIQFYCIISENDATTYNNYIIQYDNNLSISNFYYSTYSNKDSNNFTLFPFENRIKESENSKYNYLTIKSNFNESIALFIINNNLLNGKEIRIRKTKYDQFNYEYVPINSNYSFHLNSFSLKSLVLGNKQYNESFYVKIITKGQKDYLQNSSVIVNKDYKEIYEIPESENILDKKLQLFLNDKNISYYSSKNNSYESGLQSLFLSFFGEEEYEIYIENLEKDKSSFARVVSSKKNDSLKIKENTNHIFIEFNVDSFETNKEIYFEFSGKKQDFYSNEIYFRCDNTFNTSESFLKQFELLKCSNKIEKEIITFYCNYTKKEEDVGIKFILFLNDVSEIIFKNIEPFNYQKTEKGNLFLYIFIGIIVVSLVFIIIYTKKKKKTYSDDIETIDLL